MIVKRLDCLESGERGKELKVPHYASAAAARDGNLPYCDGNMPPVKATCLRQLPLAFIPNNIYILNNLTIKKCRFNIHLINFKIIIGS